MGLLFFGSERERNKKVNNPGWVSRLFGCKPQPTDADRIAAFKASIKPFEEAIARAKGKHQRTAEILTAQQAFVHDLLRRGA